LCEGFLSIVAENAIVCHEGVIAKIMNKCIIILWRTMVAQIGMSI